MSASEPLLDRIRRDGATAIVETQTRSAADADAVVRLVLTAARLDAATQAARVLALWDEAGALHDVEAIDASLARLTAGGWVPFVGAVNRRRLRDSARVAMTSTTRPGTVELAVAVLGAGGTQEDVPALETLARHPAFTLHAATALSNLDHWQGRAGLLRLLGTTAGACRVIVIDRLLPHVREPAVRLALVRDALVGLDSEHAAEVAPDIAAMCTVRDCIDDPSAPEDVKRGARLVLAACTPGRQG